MGLPSVLFDADRPPGRKVAAVFSCLDGGPVRRRGGPQRKAGDRLKNGRLRHEPAVDRGHEMTLQRRAALVGAANAGDPKAGYVVGRLALKGALADPGAGEKEGREQTVRRHNALVEFAAMHHRLWGPGTPPSHLKKLIEGFGGRSDGPDLAALGAKYGRWYSAAMLTPPAGRLLGHHAAERAALYEMEIEGGDVVTLRRVADAMVGHTARRSAPAPVAGDNAPRRKLPPPIVVYGESAADPEAVAASLAKLRAARKA